jgi:hypothetical protein
LHETYFRRLRPAFLLARTAAGLWPGGGESSLQYIVAGGFVMRKLKILVFLAVIFAATISSGYAAQTVDPNTIDLTVKIDGDRFWQIFYSTAYGDEDTVTVYKLKNIVVEIRSGSSVVDSFTFTPTSEQSHHFLIGSTWRNISVQYRANTFTDRQFSFSFDYRPGATLFITNNPSNLVVKTPFLNYR